MAFEMEFRQTEPTQRKFRQWFCPFDYAATLAQPWIMSRNNQPRFEHQGKFTYEIWKMLREAALYGGVESSDPKR